MEIIRMSDVIDKSIYEEYGESSKEMESYK